VGTPAPVKESEDGPILEKKVDEADNSNAEVTPAADTEKQDASTAASIAISTPDGARTSEQVKEKEKERLGDQEILSEDVRKKLAKLELLTSKYQDLLRNYRTAHARVSTIEPFEAALREHTSLASISDPAALVEFLNQRNVQGEMLREELRRVSEGQREVVKERDELKIRLAEAESRAKEAFDEVAGLKKERRGKGTSLEDGAGGKSTGDPLGAVNGEAEIKSADVNKGGEDETFFSYETELPRLEAEVEKQQAQIVEQQSEIGRQQDTINEQQKDLADRQTTISEQQVTIASQQSELISKTAHIDDISTQNRTLGSDLESSQADHDAARSRIQELELETAQTQTELINASNNLVEAEAKQRAAEAGLKHLVDEKFCIVRDQDSGETIPDANGPSTLAQITEAQEAARNAESQTADLKFEIAKLESEASSQSAIIASLRGLESAAESWKRKVEVAEVEREEALKLVDAKKGHEGKVAVLGGQLRRAERDRDAAYQMILDCGRCVLPQAEAGPESAQTKADVSTPALSRTASHVTEQTEVSTQPTEVSTPALSVDGRDAGPGDAKKKKKKKTKGKKKDGLDASSTFVTESATAAESTATSATPPTATAEPLPSSDQTSEQSPPPSIQALIDDPSLARSILATHKADPGFRNLLESYLDRITTERAADDAASADFERMLGERDEVISRNEGIVSSLRLEISRLEEVIVEKDAAIERLDGKLKGEEGLREEIETLRESVLESGVEATDAKFELKQLTEARERLRSEFEELEREHERLRQNLVKVEGERDAHGAKSRDLETANEELRASLTATDTTKEAERQALEEKLAASELTSQALQVAKEACEKQIEELQAQHSANGKELDAKHLSLSRDFDDLRSRAGGLETDLAAANQLAQTRFKDLTDLREVGGRLQAEVKRLRGESEELKALKVESEKASAGMKRLETRERDLKSEIERQKSEIQGLRDRVKRGEEKSSALEDTYERTRRDLEQNERTRDDAVEKRDRAQTDLKKVEEELKISKAKLEDLEKQVLRFRDEAHGLRDSLQVKAAQQASAQSLADSMADQSRELAVQMKEMQERNENLEEELGDAQRLLSERGREGETMRRLLADVEGRAESKVKEMRERLDLAVEERDRAEDEASGIGRRKAREIEDLKTKLSYAEREASRAVEAREDAQRRERDFKARQEDIERRASLAQEELAEVRAAMVQLRDALDESERQSQDLEKQRQNLGKALEDREARLEKIQKSSKAMAEEVRNLQAVGKLRQGSATIASSRSSMESSRVMSPAPLRGSNGLPMSPAGSVGGAASQGSEADTAYLKQVLLQFLEQKEKKHRMQLVPVLGRLLHFDKYVLRFDDLLSMVCADVWA